MPYEWQTYKYLVSFLKLLNLEISFECIRRTLFLPMIGFITCHKQAYVFRGHIISFYLPLESPTIPGFVLYSIIHVQDGIAKTIHSNIQALKMKRQIRNGVGIERKTTIGAHSTQHHFACLFILDSPSPMPIRCVYTFLYWIQSAAN